MSLRIAFSLILFALVGAGTAGCTDDTGARRALESQGFTDVELTGYDAFSCGRDDTFSTGFRAKNPRGARVKGTVCCGVMKSCTVRF
jgi:hypothetical protein